MYKAAASNLTPVTLELGGKNPCIVDQTAELKVAAKELYGGNLSMLVKPVLPLIIY